MGLLTTKNPRWQTAAIMKTVNHPPMPIMCAEILADQWADTGNTWKLSGIIYSMLTVEMCSTFTISDTITLQVSKTSFPQQQQTTGSLHQKAN